MKINHFKTPARGRILHLSRLKQVLLHSHFYSFTGAIMELMIIIVLSLLGLVAANEFTDH